MSNNFALLDLYIQAAIRVNKDLHHTFECKGYPVQPHQGGCAFTIPISVKAHPEIACLSISSCKIVEMRSYTPLIETALKNSDGHIVYIEELDGKDVVVHQNMDELLEYIRLLENYDPCLKGIIIPEAVKSLGYFCE
jgi:hypothetical protein